MRMDRRHFMAGAAMAGAALATGAGRGEAAERSAAGLIVDGLDTSIVNDQFLGLLRDGGVHCVHKTAHTIQDCGQILRFVDTRPDEVVMVRSVGEILAARESGRIAMFLGSQHGNEVERFMAKGTRMMHGPMENTLRSYYELGYRIFGICYNVTNVFGGGCLDPDVPLTDLGKRYVETIHELGMILDVGGHTGEQTSLDALAISAGVPVVCTHTNVAALVPNMRATSDRVFEAIAETGGVVGVTAISDFQKRSPLNYREHGAVSPQATLDEHLDQYDYLKRLIGVDHVGLGPDFVWGWGRNFDHDHDRSISFPAHALSNGNPILVENFENISELPNVVDGLRRRGWTQAELDKLLGGNWLRVYRQVWG